VNTKFHRTRKRTAAGSEERERIFYPTQLIRILMSVMGTIAVVSGVAAFYPLPLDRIANPLANPAPGTGILWILKPVVLLEKLVLNPALTISLTVVFALLFVMVPMLDLSEQRSIKRRTLVAVPFLLWMLFLALSLFFSPGVK